MPKSIRIPLLLRRGLAQLRGDPPAGWPNVTRTETPEPGAPYGSELYGPHYPFPTLARTMPHLGKRATQAQLRRMTERLETARIGTAWELLRRFAPGVSLDWRRDCGAKSSRHKSAVPRGDAPRCHHCHRGSVTSAMRHSVIKLREEIRGTVTCARLTLEDITQETTHMWILGRVTDFLPSFLSSLSPQKRCGGRGGSGAMGRRRTVRGLVRALGRIAARHGHYGRSCGVAPA